jgi:hypothetical protein
VEVTTVTGGATDRLDVWDVGDTGVDESIRV